MITRPSPTLFAAILAAGLVFLDSTVMNVVLPAMQRSFDLSFASQQWLVASYLLLLASLLMLGGALGDVLGRRRVLLWSTAGFGVISLGCALAPNAELLIAGRAVQGAIGGLLVPNTLAWLSDTLSGDERSRAIGLWTTWTGIAAILGPFVGGLLIELASWRWIFMINLPLCALIVALIRRGADERATLPGGQYLDLAGALLCVLSLGGPSFALIAQPTHGWSHPLVALPLLGGGLCALALLAVERRSRNPILPLELFANRNFAVGNACCFLLYAGLAGSLFLVVLFIQSVQGYSALEAGLAVLPITGIMFLIASRVHLLARRIGVRRLLGAGPLIAATGLLLLLQLDRHVAYASTLLPAFALVGLGIALTIAPLTTTILGAATPSHAGAAAGVTNAASRVAALAAIALAGVVFSAQFAATIDQQLAGQPLGAAAREALVLAQARPLSALVLDTVPEPEQTLLVNGITQATLAGLRSSILLSAGLTALSGVLAVIGIRNSQHTPVPAPHALHHYLTATVGTGCAAELHPPLRLGRIVAACTPWRPAQPAPHPADPPAD